MSISNRLKRNTNDKIFGGVASGIGNYFDIDSWIVRLVFIFLLFTVVGFVFYLILWIALPVETNFKPENMETQNEPKSRKSDNGNIVAGVVLISIGVIFLIERYFPEIDIKDIWPWSLIIIGILLLFKGFRKNIY